VYHSGIRLVGQPEREAGRVRLAALGAFGYIPCWERPAILKLTKLSLVTPFLFYLILFIYLFRWFLTPESKHPATNDKETGMEMPEVVNVHLASDLPPAALRPWLSRHRTLLRALLAVGFLHLLVARTWAISMSIEFQKMIDQCEVIAVARFVGEWHPVRGQHAVELELTRIIKGNIKPGKYRVSYGSMPSIRKESTEFVAFFEKDMCWTFAAQPISKENSVAEGVLQVKGFYDWNAYWVWPGLTTVAKIEKFLKDRTLSYSFRGPLCFPQRGRAEWQASTLEIEVTYDPATDRSEVRGLPELKGIPSCPEVRINCTGSDPEVTITYAEGGDRPLVIHGRVQSSDTKTGVMRTNFFVGTPTVVTRKDFESYVANPQKGPSYFVVRLACVPQNNGTKPRVLTLTMDKEPNYGTELQGWSKVPLQLDGWCGYGETMRTEGKLEDGGKIILLLDCGELKRGPNVFGSILDTSLGLNQNAWLLYRLLVGDIPGVFLSDEHGEREVMTFTATLGKVQFAERAASPSP
jgi:hypothetical protein